MQNAQSSTAEFQKPSYGPYRCVLQFSYVTGNSCNPPGTPCPSTFCKQVSTRRVRFLIWSMISALTAVVFALLANTRCNTFFISYLVSSRRYRHVKQVPPYYWDITEWATQSRFYPFSLSAHRILIDCRVSESSLGAIIVFEICFLGPI